MGEHTPTAGQGKKGGLAGCLVASLVGCGLIVALAVAAAIFIGWRLTREEPAEAAVVMRDGTETFYLHATLRGDDPGVAALVDKLLTGIRQADANHSPAARSPLLDQRRAEQWREWFPCELDVARASREGSAAESTVVSAQFPAKAGLVRAMFRLVAYFLPRQPGAPLMRADIDGTPVILGAPVEGAEMRFALALAGDRLVGARDLADLQAALRHVAVSVEGDESSTLAGTIRLDNEDGWGYSRPREAGPSDGIHIAVFSFDLQANDIVHWRAALRGEQPVTDRATAEKALIDEFARASLPEGVTLTLDDGERRWLDDRTLLIQGHVDGIEKFLGGLFEHKPELPPEPALPSDGHGEAESKPRA